MCPPRAKLVRVALGKRLTASGRALGFAVHPVNVVTEFMEEDMEKEKGFGLFESESALGSVLSWLTVDAQQVNVIVEYGQSASRAQCPL